MVDFLGLNLWQAFKVYTQMGALGKRAGFEALNYEKAAILGIPKPKIQKIFSGPQYEATWKRLEEKAPLPLLVNQPSPPLDILKITDLLTPGNIGKYILIGGLILGGLYLAGKYVGRK